MLAEGTQGHLTGVAPDYFDLHGLLPQRWELGVKEVWEVPKPLDRVIHTMGWPLRKGAKYNEFGGSFIYPMGEDKVCLGFVVGLDGVARDQADQADLADRGPDVPGRRPPCPRPPPTPGTPDRKRHGSPSSDERPSPELAKRAPVYGHTTGQASICRTAPPGVSAEIARSGQSRTRNGSVTVSAVMVFWTVPKTSTSKGRPTALPARSSRLVSTMTA